MKPTASLSLDLDNLWAYMKTHGDAGWETFPSYLESVIPRLLRFFAQRDLRLTFFVVGQDLANERTRESIRSISAAGHEIGNHSFSHEPWLIADSELRIEREIAHTEELIESLGGGRPVGFRGPGYCFSSKILRILKRREYLYDASLLPTWLGPLARAYYLATTRFNEEDLKKRSTLFGSFGDGFRPLKVHQLVLDSADLLEIPVTTMPLLRVPMHVSYALYLATYSRKLAISYFRTSLALCRISGVQPSLLLHPLDFMDRRDAPALAFFPAMNLAAEKKIDLVGEIMDRYCAAFSVRTLKEHATDFLDAVGDAQEPQRSSAF